MTIYTITPETVIEAVLKIKALTADNKALKGKITAIEVDAAEKVGRLTAEVERLKEDYATALRRERSTYDQKTRNYKKFKQAETQIANLKAALEARNKILKACYDDIAVGGYIIEQIEAL